MATANHLLSYKLNGDQTHKPKEIRTTWNKIKSIFGIKTKYQKSSSIKENQNENIDNAHQIPMKVGQSI